MESENFSGDTRETDTCYTQCCQRIEQHVMNVNEYWIIDEKGPTHIVRGSLFVSNGCGQ